MAKKSDKKDTKDEKPIIDKRRPFFSRIVELINKLSPARAVKAEKKESHFSTLLLQADKKHPSFEIVNKAASLCDEAILIAKQRIQIIRRVHYLDEKMVELSCYERLTDEEINNLKNLIERFLALNKDRNALRFQMTGFDKGLVEMESQENEARLIISQMEESERSRKIFRHDLNLLQGEKSQLEYDYEQMQNASEFVRKLSFFLTVFFGISAVGLMVMVFSDGSSAVFAPAAALCVLLIVIVGFIYVFRQKVGYELKLNLIKQQKAVELLNKKSVVYAYHVNFLKFVYKKYNVRSSDRLKKNLKDFSDYKNVTYRYDSIRSAMYQTEYEIESFLREKNISNAMITIEKFAKTVNLDDKRKVYNDYATEKRRLEKRLDDLDRINDGIWAELNVLIELDATEEKLVNQIIDQFTSEVERLARFGIIATESGEDDTNDMENAEETDEELDSMEIIKMDPRYKL
ncbi:MAG: hypothetical protein LBU94_00430 [Clostridiales bacterium]|jgi:hypothetical protein|nr:hypothetical protein [Clostridiales bacterium]